MISVALKNLDDTVIVSSTSHSGIDYSKSRQPGHRLLRYTWSSNEHVITTKGVDLTGLWGHKKDWSDFHNFWQKCWQRAWKWTTTGNRNELSNGTIFNDLKWPCRSFHKTLIFLNVTLSVTICLRAFKCSRWQGFNWHRFPRSLYNRWASCLTDLSST